MTLCTYKDVAKLCFAVGYGAVFLHFCDDNVCSEFSLCVDNFVGLYSTSSALFVYNFGRSTQVHSVGCFKCCPCLGLYSDVVHSIILCKHCVYDSLTCLVR